MFRTGLVSVSFREHTPREILTAMKNVGLRYIEWGSDVHAPADDVDALTALAALQREFGIAAAHTAPISGSGRTARRSSCAISVPLRCWGHGCCAYGRAAGAARTIRRRRRSGSLRSAGGWRPLPRSRRSPLSGVP